MLPKARILFSTSKKPVFIGFDINIKELNKNNFEVNVCVSDWGGGNVALWKGMDKSIAKKSLSHPLTNIKILLGNVPHVPKLIKNGFWIMDSY